MDQCLVNCDFLLIRYHVGKVGVGEEPALLVAKVDWVRNKSQEGEAVAVDPEYNNIAVSRELYLRPLQLALARLSMTMTRRGMLHLEL